MDSRYQDYQTGCPSPQATPSAYVDKLVSVSLS